MLEGPSFNELSVDCWDGVLVELALVRRTESVHLMYNFYLGCLPVTTATLTRTLQLNCYIVIRDCVSLSPPLLYPSPMLASYRYSLVYLNLVSVCASQFDWFCLKVLKQCVFSFTFTICIQFGWKMKENSFVDSIKTSVDLESWKWSVIKATLLTTSTNGDILKCNLNISYIRQLLIKEKKKNDEN